jgi:alkylation response protein AidB-like acyl-CoA dehydrogenase
MNFNLTDEQAMLRDGVQRFVARSCSFEHRLRLRHDAGFERSTWNAMCELGWLAAAVPSELGGLGFTPVETALIAEELGRGLVLEPLVACGVLPIALVRQLAAPAQQEALLEAISVGEHLFAAALSETDARGDIARIEARAEHLPDGRWRLQGRKTLVVGAPVADRFIVAARVRGAAGDIDGLCGFVVDKAARGLQVEGYKLVDGGPAGDVVLDGLVVEATAALGEPGMAHAGLQAALDEAIVAQCAETVGGLEDVLSLCSDYLKTRRQFGVAIGSFQALQHRMADMAIETMQARASLHRALAALAQPQAPDRSELISGCKAQVMKSAKFVTAQGIQLHGGYGITEEYRVGHHYRRLVQTDALFGGMEHHLQRYARTLQRSARAPAIAAQAPA